MNSSSVVGFETVYVEKPFKVSLHSLPFVKEGGGWKCLESPTHHSPIGQV